MRHTRRGSRNSISRPRVALPVRRHNRYNRTRRKGPPSRRRASPPSVLPDDTLQDEDRRLVLGPAGEGDRPDLARWGEADGEGVALDLEDPLLEARPARHVDFPDQRELVDPEVRRPAHLAVLAGQHFPAGEFQAQI